MIQLAQPPKPRRKTVYRNPPPEPSPVTFVELDESDILAVHRYDRAIRTLFSLGAKS